MQGSIAQWEHHLSAFGRPSRLPQMPLEHEEEFNVTRCFCSTKQLPPTCFVCDPCEICHGTCRNLCNHVLHVPCAFICMNGTIIYSEMYRAYRGWCFPAS